MNAQPVRDTGGVSATTDLPPAASPEPTGVPGAASPAPADTAPASPDAALPPAKRKRGLESLGDMVRSLAVVMVIVLGLFFFALPPSSDRKAERDVNPAADVRSFTQVVPAALVPGALPGGWRSTVATYDSEPNRLRIGYLTAANHYVEYAAVEGPSATYVANLTDRAAALRTVDVAGQPWQLVQDEAHRQSLIRQVGQTTVVVGSLRNNATLDELLTLAASLRASA